MPGADELFRSTAAPAAPEPEVAPAPAAPADPPAKPAASGRVKHDEKITVYVTAEELLALEQARLAVRAVVGRNVDRGRIVRAALAASLEDLEARGGESDLVRRIEGSSEPR
ncbi:MAG: hypothetical protein P1U38_16540 [Aeromicrobium sp.]|uniref:hypothetical protein n=1 Tax=Aeromicrobium sp. TaxID=1871063 RepID=UPI00260AA84E|nr:hypothetical protein [Aeromicrobium sp.]MDF1706375.1 hypothetical protein [Aeromicrobium sp.]